MLGKLGDHLGDLFLGMALPLSDKLNDHYAAARGWIRRDPLAIDLDGDGIETVGIAGGVLFDHDGDGIKTGTGWVKSDDALVVLDRNGNGLIDTGNELFGVDYVKSNGQKALNGFDALADLDGNGDHLFNASDAQYANVKIWRDMNQDGISQANELQSLSAAGITAINLTAHSATKNLGNGNTQTLSADVAGNVGDIVALNLADNPFYRAFPDHLDTTAVASLPDMQGSGRLRDLKEAATLSTTLASQLADLQANYRTHDQYAAALDSLILNWANTSDWSTTPVELSDGIYARAGRRWRVAHCRDQPGPAPDERAGNSGRRGQRAGCLTQNSALAGRRVEKRRSSEWGMEVGRMTEAPGSFLRAKLFRYAKWVVLALALAYLAQFIRGALYKGQSRMGAAFETIAHEALRRQYDGIPQMRVSGAGANPAVCSSWNFEEIWGRCVTVGLHVRDYLPEHQLIVEREVMKLAEQLRKPCVLLPTLGLSNEQQLAHDLECGNFMSSFKLRIWVNSVTVIDDR